ncbi:hypothetical protein J7384_05645 [Endozoicomonas sp. G2_1]|uniref:hypothetical protein n=1 Tax=Endozoicomonas sp. G2_1 TaxID=2821091 RepID=UPI001ADC6812|nr:hypothetical protein [Endozoicomonas sp. G2_1]MBO9489839.1 hypothetical protein [Endozoicomonas sp. G2_1]
MVNTNKEKNICQVRAAVAKAIKGHAESVILCGHYLLRWKDKIYSDHLGEWPNEDHIQSFCSETFDIGCEQASATGHQSVKLLLLANDWQNLNLDRRIKTKEKQILTHELLSNYYSSLESIPKFLLKKLSAFSLEPSCIEKYGEQNWIFSEYALRESFAQYINSIESSNDSIFTYTQNSQKITAINTNSYDIEEYHSNPQSVPLLCENSANCAGEVIELLKEMENRGVNSMVIIYPLSCFNFVNLGTLVFKELFPSSSISITNIALPVTEGSIGNGMKLRKF